jgi:transcriptional regulator with XRE-family HTH domain
MNKNNQAERLRVIRKSKGWSLQDVENHSNGKWKAVVIGSYERGDRAISLKKAISLMEFYQVPVSELFRDCANSFRSKLNLGFGEDFKWHRCQH